MASWTRFSGRDVAAIEEFLRVVCSGGYDGPAPDTRAVELVRSVIAHQHTVEAETSELGLAEDAAAYLAACANAVVTAESVPVEPPPEPRTADEPVRRAVAFMQKHLRDELAIADIAAAGFVSVRTIQMAFRHHLHTTPMAYLRELRLHAAHDELDQMLRRRRLHGHRDRHRVGLQPSRPFRCGLPAPLRPIPAHHPQRAGLARRERTEARETGPPRSLSEQRRPAGKLLLNSSPAVQFLGV